jgi:hypothetical protein
MLREEMSYDRRGAPAVLDPPSWHSERETVFGLPAPLPPISRNASLKGAMMGNSKRENAFFWKSENVAKCLQVGLGTIKRWLSEGLITEADGWIKAGKQNRFIRIVVLARIEAGRFAKGLDGNGRPWSLMDRNGDFPSCEPVETRRRVVATDGSQPEGRRVHGLAKEDGAIARFRSRCPDLIHILLKAAASGSNGKGKPAGRTA